MTFDLQYTDTKRCEKYYVKDNPIYVRAVLCAYREETQDTLNKVLYELSNQMKNAYSRSDA